MTTDTLAGKVLRFIVVYFVNIIFFPILKIYEKFFWPHDDWKDTRTKWSPGAATEAKARHAEKVKRVQEQVKAWNANGRKGHMCTRRPAWKSITVHAIDKNRFTQIEVDLDDIVDIDTEKKVLTVEAGMSMGRLTSILLPMGWTIPVIPELELLTFGGVICGAGLETSSHKYGLIADTVISHEFVLASGEVVNCSETENPDLHHCINMSHGTLGFLTAVQIPLIPATKYIKVDYYATNTVQGIEDLLQKGFRESEFVEGFMYSQDNAVIMLANFAPVDPKPEQVNYINKWYKPWFYKHVEDTYAKFSATSPNACVGTEFIPIRDFYHRHSRGIFWEMKNGLPYGNSVWFRYLFGWAFPVNYQLVKKFGMDPVHDMFLVENHVLQDFVIPIDRLEATLQFSHDLVEVYPIWLCPVVYLNKPGRGRPTTSPAEMYIDVGIYGNTPKVDTYDNVRTTKQMEQFVLANNGFQGTYADIYMTREEFDKMYENSTAFYDAVRNKYGAKDAFPDVYDKVSYQARRGELDSNKNKVQALNGHEKKLE